VVNWTRGKPVTSIQREQPLFLLDTPNRGAEHGHQGSWPYLRDHFDPACLVGFPRGQDCRRRAGAACTSPLHFTPRRFHGIPPAKHLFPIIPFSRLGSLGAHSPKTIYCTDDLPILRSASTRAVEPRRETHCIEREHYVISRLQSFSGRKLQAGDLRTGSSKPISRWTRIIASALCRTFYISRLWPVDGIGAHFNAPIQSPALYEPDRMQTWVCLGRLMDGMLTLTPDIAISLLKRTRNMAEERRSRSCLESGKHLYCVHRDNHSP